MKLTNSRVIGICLIVSASFFASSSSYADSNILKACVKKSNGATRIISGKMKCVKTERQVSLASTTENSVSAAGAAGAAGATGATGAVGATGLQGPAGATGADGVDGTNGTNGVNGISKALVASGNQVSINQGSEGVVLSATIPAGSYVMDLSASLNYSNGNTAMAGDSHFGCFITTSASYTGAATDATTVIWPESNNATPFRVSFENHSATSDEVMRRTFNSSNTLTLASTTAVVWACRHYSLVMDDANERITIRYPRIILTAVNELVTLTP